MTPEKAQEYTRYLKRQEQWLELKMERTAISLSYLHATLPSDTATHTHDHPIQGAITLPGRFPVYGWISFYIWQEPEIHFPEKLNYREPTLRQQRMGSEPLQKQKTGGIYEIPVKYQDISVLFSVLYLEEIIRQEIGMCGRQNSDPPQRWP